MGHKPKFLSIAIAPILFSSGGDFLVVAEILQTLYFQVYTFSEWHKLSSVMAQKVTKSSIIHQLKLKQKKSFEIAKKTARIRHVFWKLSLKFFVTISIHFCSVSLRLLYQMSVHRSI